MNPVLAEVVRSGFVESVHRGALVVTGPEGDARLALGDVISPVFPRSSNKPLQAVGMLRSGLDFTGEDLALACASHSGEPGHVKRVLELLEAAGLTRTTWPARPTSRCTSRACATPPSRGA